MRKVLCLILVVFLLAGCTGTNENATTESETSKSGEKSTDKETKTETAKEEYKINFPCIWVGKDSKANMVAAIVDEFNNNNKGYAQVVIEEIADYDAYEDKMRTNLAANTVPDVFTFKHGSQTQIYFESNKMMDFSPYMNEGWKNDFLPDAINEVTHDGKILAVPYEFGVTPVMYNDGLLKSAGITSFPETYDDFFAACDKLMDNGTVPMSHMTADNAWTSMLWYSQLVHSIGGPDVYERGFDDPAFLEAAKVIQKMFEYTTSDAVGADAAVAAGHFLNENTAMLMNGPWFIGRIKSEGANNMYENVHIAPAPYYEGGKGAKGGYVGFIQANLSGAIQEDKGKEEAVVEFLKYLTLPDNVKRISLESGSLFVVKFDPGNDVEKLQGEMINQLNESPYVVAHFNSMVKPGVASEFPQALSSLVLGESTPEEFVEHLKKADEMY